MLRWLASKFEQSRASLQAKLEKSLPSAKTPTLQIDIPNWLQLGNAALDAGDLAHAARCYQSALDLSPNDVSALVNLGFVKSELQLFDESRRLLALALALDPSNMDAWYMTGGALAHGNDWHAAEAAFRKVIELQPSFALAYWDLCHILFHSGKLVSAKNVIQTGMDINPNHPEFHFYMGNIFVFDEDYLSAQACFDKALVIRPDYLAALINLGLALHSQGDVYSAIDVFRDALKLSPDDARVHCNLGGSLQISGDLKHAIQHYREALRTAPSYTTAQQNLLYALSFYSECSPAEYLQESKLFGTKISSQSIPFSEWHGTSIAVVERPLRIGFVSGDLCNHPVGNFLESVLQSIDSSKLILVAYSTLRKEDVLTARVKPFFAEWSVVESLADNQLAAKIHADRIDILIDLAGHTAGNRLPVFAWRPAPIQVAWLGYWATTGVSEMDYILVDALSVPESDQPFFSEKPWYLPDTRFCFTPPVNVSDVSSLPALRNGYITFGSFQLLSKMSDAVLAVWSKILVALPESRLRLQCWQLGYPAAQQKMLRRLKEMGVSPSRVDISGGTSRDVYLAAYSEVDIILDTFPFPGGTTTAEALWMGVPTVTLAGDTLLARQGYSLLDCVGLGDWVAKSEREFIDIALAYSQDFSALRELRTGLRMRTLASPLFDAVQFSGRFENALMEMWRTRLG